MKAPAQDASAFKVIVVDDFPDTARMLCTVMQFEHYACTVTYSGEEAMDCCDREQFDCMLLDYQLGGITGLDVAQALAQHPHRPGCIIMISAQPIQLFTDALESGDVDDYIMKPADTEEILARVAVGRNRSRSV